MADKEKECVRALFRIDVDLQEFPSNKFKIKKNALQLHLGGIFIVVDKRLAPHLNNVVLVEGGVRVIKKYKRLMMRRIKWSEQVKDGDDQKDVGEESEESEIKESID